MEGEICCENCKGKFDELDHVPMTLPCSHPICSNCLNNFKPGDKFQCPKCGLDLSKVNLKELKPHQMILSLIRNNLNSEIGSEEQSGTEQYEQSEGGSEEQDENESNSQENVNNNNVLKQKITEEYNICNLLLEETYNEKQNELEKNFFETLRIISSIKKE